VCPVCGHGIWHSRGIERINPLALFGYHEGCTEPYKNCHICHPKVDKAFLMWVGEKFYTPQGFIEEAYTMGVSKRIANVPRDLIIGKTVVYLAHRKCAPVPPEKLEGVDQPELIEGEGYMGAGIFSAFVPQRVELLIWESKATPEYLESLEKRGITPVIIKDGDTDHA
jgi:hypothetical protein